MKIDTSTLIPVAAVVSSVLLLLAGKQRVLEVIALVASAAWLLVELDILNWPFSHRYASAGIIIGATLVVTGVIVYLNTSNKREVTASTVITILGGVFLLAALNKLG
jgi:hypothetical protein